MSTLVQRVSDDLKKAMLAKDAPRVNALRMVRAAFIEASKLGTGEVTEEGAVEVLRRIRKQRIDAAEEYVKANRPDLADAERVDVAIIDDYLPKLADEATTLEWVRAAIAASGATSVKQMGKVIGLVMKDHKADADGALVRALIERELGGA
ncbi:GatB/YqeY domain-containing protein [Myxococcota bacterium]|nr:GatB/YqeY domain-containing protein [Myxococcota bacterium]